MAKITTGTKTVFGKVSGLKSIKAKPLEPEEGVEVARITGPFTLEINAHIQGTDVKEIIFNGKKFVPQK